VFHTECLRNVIYSSESVSSHRSRIASYRNKIVTIFVFLFHILCSMEVPL